MRLLGQSVELYFLLGYSLENGFYLNFYILDKFLLIILSRLDHDSVNIVNCKKYHIDSIL